MSSLYARGLSGLPEIAAATDLGELIAAAVEAEPTTSPLADGQIVAIAHKAVSKAEGAVVDLRNVMPSARAQGIASEQHKDPRAVQVVLDQSEEILREANGVLICRTKHGFVCANAGVDASNSANADTLIVLPRDPDASARAIRERLRELTGANVGVLISDSFGRAWRHGQCDVAIGCAGLTALEDWRGREDSVGMELRATWLAVADAVASLADLARAKDSREPVVIVEGLERFVTEDDGPGALALLRPLAEDLFR
ncbi:MAG TPA: coenzyme F420-0:L-glutamate ligase [Solirubrobacteraceae bacterium]|jgi:coenzyme F420-0:L-glutamate ligase/coenzyme F420-1:gamma-L-glutamate ligase|nr:coenzyme F420-0:L-glutamate ligase [Solirubrobacteraceae bacterium]